MAEHYSYCIIGFGIAGQILAIELLKASIPPENIVICDENFLGGDLATIYGSVMSNTPWWKLKRALEQYTQSIVLSKFTEEECTPVREIANAFLQTALLYSKDIKKYTTTVTSLQYSNNWIIEHTSGSFEATTVFLTIGGTPSILDTPMPQIPLPVALDPEILKTQVSSSDTIVLFGTSHSGTIAIDNLQKQKVFTYALYNGSQPFRFAPEAYDGLKEGSAIIAKAVLSYKYRKISLVSTSNSVAVNIILSKATKAIVATGFKPKSPFGEEFLDYDPETAKLTIHTNIYGFGMAYPGVTAIANRIYQDNSVLSYQSQIRRCLPAILQT